MARSAVTVADLAAFNTGYDITPDAIDLANGHEIDITDIKSDLFQVMIENTTTNAGTVTFVAGAGSEASQGDLELALGDSEIKVIALESARFKDASGKLNIDVAGSGVAGRVFASELPK